ncbi:unnamed protein product [Kluyveromyces dobzhanskii CBS 2104]|uniref:WGS project CCBQ000000000 data, contig 00099 n=1 Tax=Kluyveromyces dobzhanskii CBS 2104 TaxID=1427455 RepID=A0A0A8L4R4_9SACH|nr:unnamed protein product [Kluyveromyces dobzhanskii CBS 2104]
MPSIAVDYVLFDLDGTLVSSTDAAEQAWLKLCEKYNVDYNTLSQVSHGSRTEEILAKFFPDVDNTNNQAVKEFELSIANDYMDIVCLVPGSADLLISLDRPTGSLPGEVFHHRKWAVVTSGSPWVAHAWFDNLLKSIKKPEVFITAFDVAKGKPDPAGYALATEQLKKVWNDDRKEVNTVVFEDAPVGVKAGKANGSIVVALTSTYDKELLFDAGADYVVEDLTQICLRSNKTNETVLIITDPLDRDGDDDEDNDDDFDDEEEDDNND